MADALSILDYYHDAGVRSTLIQSEGEVLVYPDYERVLEHAISKGFNRSPLVTNGILLHRFHDLVFRYVNAVTISVDGPDPESYKMTRGGTLATFNRVTDNIRGLVEEKKRRNAVLPITINMIVSGYNIHLVRDMIEYAQRLGVDTVRLGNFHPIFEGAERPLRPMLASDAATVDLLLSITGRADYGVNILMQSPYRLLEHPECDMLTKYHTIGAQGGFSPCCHVPPDAAFGAFDCGIPGPVGLGGLDAFKEAFSSAGNHLDLPRTCVYCPRLSPEYIKFEREGGVWSGVERLEQAAESVPLPWD